MYGVRLLNLWKGIQEYEIADITPHCKNEEDKTLYLLTIKAKTDSHCTYIYIGEAIIIGGEFIAVSKNADKARCSVYLSTDLEQTKAQMLDLLTDTPEYRMMLYKAAPNDDF